MKISKQKSREPYTAVLKTKSERFFSVFYIIFVSKYNPEQALTFYMTVTKSTQITVLINTEDNNGLIFPAVFSLFPLDC